MKHGHASRLTGKSKTYRIWSNIKARCQRRNHPRYADWGGRGITVCARWQTFDNFVLDMGECPEGMSLDRADNNKGYSFENCRWATHKQQGLNKRSSKLEENEFDQIAGLYSLNYSAKEIACFFGICEEYVVNLYYQKRKKLGLDRRDRKKRSTHSRAKQA